MIGPHYAIDYQVHSLRSHDGQATIHDHCLSAIEIGLDQIGFSEHKDFDPADPATPYFQYEEYMRDIERARAEFGCGLVIRAGVEIDYQRWFEDEIAEYLSRHPFDFVIGSVHYVDRKMLMTEEYLEGRTAQEAYSVYFDALFDSVESGLFDILGHMEYAKRRGVLALGPYDPKPHLEQVERLFRAMISRSVALEINTAGLRHEVGMYPCETHVKLYAALGGKLLSFGSDAHHPDELGFEFGSAAGLAQDSGFSEVTTWSNRHPTQRSMTR